MKREKWDEFVERLAAFGVDRWMHIVLIMVVAWVASVLFLPFGFSRFVRGILAVLGGAVFAIGKEAYDKKTTGVVERKDLIADGIGLVLYFLISVV